MPIRITRIAPTTDADGRPVAMGTFVDVLPEGFRTDLTDPWVVSVEVIPDEGGVL